MAAWQFDIQFVRTDRLSLLTAGDVRQASCLSLADYDAAKGRLDEVGLAPEGSRSDWRMYGDAKGNRVDLVLTENGEAEVSARIDAAGEADLFCDYVCVLAADLGCVLWSSEMNCVFKPTKQALVTAMMESDAWMYALDPSSFLRDVRN